MLDPAELGGVAVGVAVDRDQSSWRTTFQNPGPPGGPASRPAPPRGAAEHLVVLAALEAVQVEQVDVGQRHGTPWDVRSLSMVSRRARSTDAEPGYRRLRKGGT